jgi:predicted glycosyltransferase
LVFAHCGENALAEIAASRVPAIIVPESRPHEEQQAMGIALGASGMPVTVVDMVEHSLDAEAAESAVQSIDWAQLVRETADLDGEAWAAWCDGAAAARAAAIVERVSALATGDSASSRDAA